MKRLYTILLSFSVFTIISCNKADTIQPISDGAMVLVTNVTSPILDISDIENAAFTGSLSIPSANVKSVTLSVSLERGKYISDH